MLKDELKPQPSQSQQQQPQPQPASQWGLSAWTRNSSAVHESAGGPHGKKANEATHITNTSSPLMVFMSYFVEIFK
jgi:hypothetical protein